MVVDNKLLREFVKITNDDKQEKTDNMIYGTIVTNGDNKFVKMDGSEILTPISTTTDVRMNDRVTVNIQNRTAIVTGNLSDPSAGGERVSNAEGNIEKFDNLFAGNISAENIAANSITSDKILAGAITTDKLMADSITATKIQADAIQSNHIGANTINAGHIQADAIDAGHIQADSIGAEHIKADSIDAEHITSESIDSNHIKANAIDAGHINANSINSGHINSGTIDSNHIKANAIDAGHIKANAIEAGHISSDSIETDHLVSGTITADKIATDAITAGSGIIAEGAIGNAMISDLDAGKITAGKIDTSKVEVAGVDGHLRIKGNRMQVFNGIGANAKERVSVGDVNGDGTVYGLRVRGADGQTILLDENGVKSEGITDGSITNDKISNDAEIDGAKLNINSVVNKINEDGTEVIKGTKIEVDGTTLTTKLSTITDKQTEDGEKISQNTTLIKANENSIKLKVDEQTYTTDKNNMTSELNKHTSEINTMKDEISLKVEQTDINNSIKDLDLKTRNYIKDSAEERFIESTGQSNKVGANCYFVDGITYLNTIHQKQVTIGFDWEYVGETPSGKFHPQYNNPNYTSLGANVTITEDNKSGTYVSTRTPNTEKDANGFYIRTDDMNGKLVIKNPRLFLGSKDYGWTPAHEDMSKEVDTKITTAKAEIKVTTDKITQDVSKLETNVENKADGSTVTSLSNKVGTLETSVNGIKGQVSSLETTTTKHTTDISKAQTDATNANTNASNAQNTANTNKNNITSLTTEVTNTKNQVATLDVNLNSITQRVSNTESTTATLTTNVNNAQIDATNAMNKVDNLKIGGTNYYKYSKGDSKSGLYKNFNTVTDDYAEITLTSQNNHSGASISDGCLLECRDYKVGEKVTISFDIMYTKWDFPIGSNQQEFWFGQRYTNSSTSTDGQWRNVAIVDLPKVGQNGCELNKWFRVEKTVTIPTQAHESIGSENLIKLYNKSDIKASVTLRMRNAKIEYGDRATDWTPSNVEINDSIETNKIEISKTNSQVASIETNLNSITQRVSKTETDVVTVTNTANTANSKIDGLEVGGTNLLRKNGLILVNSATGDFDETTNIWTITASPGSSSWGRGLKIKYDSDNQIVIPYGKSLIYSFEINVPISINWEMDINNAPIDATSWSGNDNDNGSKRNWSNKKITITNKWVRCWYSIENTSANNTYNADLKDVDTICGVVTTNLDSDITFKIRNFKVEVGNKATDWSPCPKDVDSAIETNKIEISKTNTNVSEIKTDLSGITSRVSTAESIIEKSSSLNLLYNSDFKIINGSLPDKWSVGNSTKITYDGANTNLDGVGTFKFNVTGETNNNYFAVLTPYVKASKSEKFTASAYFYSTDWSVSDNGVALEIEFHSPTGRLSTVASAVNKNLSGWQRVVVTGTAPENTTTVRVRAHPIRNGVFHTSKFMLQNGDTVAPWQKGFDYVDITTRVATAESKITEDAITNTVKKNFYTKSETDGQITSKGYQTASDVQQTVDKLEVKFSESGGYNLLMNSGFKNGLKSWTTQQFGTAGTNQSITTWNDSNQYVLPGRNSISIRSTNLADRYGVHQAITVKGGATYSFSCLSAGHRNTKQTVIIRKADGNFLWSQDVDPIGGGKNISQWRRMSGTFTVPEGETALTVCLYMKGNGSNNDAYVWFTDVNLVEGKITEEWSPHPSEVYDGIITMDKDGLTVESSNVKSKTSMTSSGFKITKTDTSEDVFKVNSDGTLDTIGSVTTRTSGARSILTGDGINFYNGSTHIGKVSYDSTGAGSTQEAKDRMWLRSIGSYALKLQSGGDMSIQAGTDSASKVLWLKGSKTHITNNLEMSTGSSITSDSIYAKSLSASTGLTVSGGNALIQNGEMRVDGLLTFNASYYNGLTANLIRGQYGVMAIEKHASDSTMHGRIHFLNQAGEPTTCFGKSFSVKSLLSTSTYALESTNPFDILDNIDTLEQNGKKVLVQKTSPIQTLNDENIQTNVGDYVDVDVTDEGVIHTTTDLGSMVALLVDAVKELKSENKILKEKLDKEIMRNTQTRKTII